MLTRFASPEGFVADRAKPSWLSTPSMWRCSREEALVGLTKPDR